VGGDGLIGRSLRSFFGNFECSCRFEYTSRRVETSDLKLDLTRLKETKVTFGNYEAIVLLAGMTQVANINENLGLSWQTNVEAYQQLLLELSPNQRIIFVSSNRVFANSRRFHEEIDQVNPSPLSAYGQQKAIIETLIRQLDLNATILRCTKIFNLEKGFISASRDALSRGEKITAYSNSFISPLSIKQVVEAIEKTIFDPSIRGIKHLSANFECNYYDLISSIAIKEFGSAELVTPILNREFGIGLYDRLKVSAVFEGISHNILTLEDLLCT